jgi:galactokinase
MKEEAVRCSTPGRVCLFGEHQDYLHLPVIPCAISLRIAVEGSARDSREVHIRLPDIGAEERFSLDGPLRYVAERDYFRSAVNVLRRHGYTFSRGFECEVRGDIPINAGTSSSSALIVSWASFLALMSDRQERLDAESCARLAHEAEVLEFGEPGGMMDHYSTACGGVIFLEFEPATRVAVLQPLLGSFVLGDSGEPKDTKGILARVKDQVVSIARQLAAGGSGFSLFTTSLDELPRFSGHLNSEQKALLAGTLRNRDITLRARQLLSTRHVDHMTVGSLLTEHQDVLRDVLRISTPKIDRMIEAALSAGAYGAKINGSGGGGCMFAYAPEHPREVAEAIKRAGGEPYIVATDTGTRVERTGIAD